MLLVDRNLINLQPRSYGQIRSYGHSLVPHCPDKRGLTVTVVRGIVLATQRTGTSRVWASVEKRSGLNGICQYRYQDLKSTLLN